MVVHKLKLGVDIGGSKINIVVWDGKKVIKRWRTTEASLEKLREGILYFNIAKVGIGVPGILDFKTGKILKCPNLPCLNGLNLKKFLKKDIRVDNDAKCFLRAEMMLGAGKGYSNILAVTMGTGIGGAIIINKKLKIKNKKLNNELVYRGKNGSAGEFGHIVLDRGRTWEQLYQQNRAHPEQEEKINAIGIANLINIFDPELIILGGGGAKVPRRELVEKYVISPLAKKTKLVLGKLGEDAGAIGAALLFE